VTADQDSNDANTEEPQTFVDARHATGVQIGENNTLINYHYHGTRRYTIEGFPAPTAPDAGWLMDQPSRLLDARSQVVPFTGRDAELRRLQEWRDSTNVRLSVLLLHAPGGQGKTRLAAEFAERSQAQTLPASQRWHVLQAGLYSTTTSSSRDNAQARGDDAGVFLIIDYADRWAHSELERLLADPVLNQPRPTRVLLISRTVRWYAAIRGDLADRRATAEDFPLPPLVADRQAMFAAARDRYGEPDLYDLPDATSIEPPGSLEHRDYGLTLTLHMAALVAVDANKRGERPPSNPHELSAYLLDREYRAWQRLADAAGHGKDYKTRPALMARAVFTATLTGAVSHDTGTRAIQALDLPGHPQDLLIDHRFCYPPADRELVLEPLYPDRLAEDFLGLLIPGHDITAYDPDPWATTVPATLLTADGIRPAIAARAIAFLGSAASRWPHVGRKALYPLLRAHPDLALDAGSAALTALADIDDIPTDVLLSVDRLLPDGPHVDLDVGAAAITEALMPRLLDIEDDPDGRALFHMNYSTRLAAVGRRAEAVEQAQHAVDYYTDLAEGDRSAHLADLATALHVYADRLNAAGRKMEALAVSERTLEYLTELAEGDPAAHLPFLAGRLAKHAALLAASGRREEALAVSGRAVDLHEELVARDRTAQLADHDRVAYSVTLSALAGSLTEYARLLAASGRREEALAVSRRTVDLHEELVAGDRAAYLPSLATSFDRHSWWLAEIGQREEALVFSRRAVDLSEELVSANRGAHLVNLTASVINHANRLTEAGRQAEALDYSCRAVDLSEELTERDRDAHLPTVAMAVSNHAVRLAEAGRQAEALDCSRRAVEFGEELTQRDRAANLPDLAMSMHNYALELKHARRWAEALTSSRRAVDLREELAASDRAAHLPGLLASTHNHAVLLSLVGQADEAQRFSQRALELREEMTQGHRDARLPNLEELEGDAADGPASVPRGLAQQLTNHASQLAWDGQQDEALDFSHRIVERYRELAEVHPDVYLPDLASALSAFAQIRVMLNKDLDHVLPAADQAFQAYQALANQEPEEFTDNLLDAAKTLTDTLKKLGRIDEAEQIHCNLADESEGTNARRQ
jgi:hypothetical protein